MVMVTAVREAMMPEPMTINASLSIVDAARFMRAWEVDDLLIVDDQGRFVGLLTNRDIAVTAIASGRHPATLTAGRCCDPHACTVEVDNPADDAAELVQRHQLQRLPVLDEGRLVGTVWASDLAAGHVRIVRSPGDA
jgi:CBS domain-containing protein